MRYLPNVISALRLTAVPVLIWLAWSGADRAFAWLLVAAGVTDILDGWLARKYGWVSKAGALLDSTADIAIVLVVLFAIWTLHNDVFVYHGAIIWAVLAVWSLANLAGLFRYHRLPSFHTASARFSILMFGVFVLVLFFYGFVPWLLYVSGTICLLAGIESLILVLLIDHWRPNLRGGIRALIRAKTKRKPND
jgi:phosphatidylglycerophosphate synthase